VTGEEAGAYCAWVGARLPRVGEWLLAARGQQVQRFPWGVNRASCAERPNLHHFDPQCCGVDCTSPDAGLVGQHPAGDSALGLADVLMTPSEIVAGDPDAVEVACHDPKSTCIVTGLEPSAIDSFQREPAADAGAQSPSNVTSFRCVWEGAMP
jgi:hypothetical protein